MQERESSFQEHFAPNPPVCHLFQRFAGRDQGTEDEKLPGWTS